MFWHRLTGFGSVTLKRVLSGCGRMRKALRLVRRSNQGSCDSTVKRWRYDVDIVGSLLAIDLWKIKSAIPILKIKIALSVNRKHWCTTFLR